MRVSFRQFVACATIASGALLTTASSLVARPVQGRVVDDRRGDTVGHQMLTGELGDFRFFPLGESIDYHDHRLHFTVGVPDDGIANDWIVHIKNVSGQAWANLFYVADAGATIGNSDGVVEDVAGAPGVFSDAFMIDATGLNNNLFTESILADGVFQPGEEWEFAVSNFGTGVNSRAPELITPGVFSGSSPLQPTGGNASILAIPVPEPATLGAAVVLGLSAIARRQRRP
jgi:hypothetical protein